MAHATGAFSFEINVYGALITVRQHLQLGRCQSDGEVDHNIRLLKDDLDELAKRMKVAIREEHQKPLF
jgi:hypothetical protein